MRGIQYKCPECQHTSEDAVECKPCGAAKLWVVVSKKWMAKQNTKAIQEWERKTGRVFPRPPAAPASTWSVLAQGSK